MGMWNYLYADVEKNFKHDGMISDRKYYDYVRCGERFKLLIPKEFGGGFIFEKEGYDGYGKILDKKTGLTYDLYELLGIWNLPSKCIFENKIKSVDKNTKHNREIGIELGCYPKQLIKLKYPTKLVHVRYKGDYEDCPNISYSGQF